MSPQVFPIRNERQYRMAGPTDLIELVHVQGNNALFLPKWLLETIVYGIVHHEFIHLSGPTGSAKSSLLEALYLVPDNFLAICRALGYPLKPLKLYPVEMATYEAPGELYQRRSLRDGTTYDEKSRLVLALEDAEAVKHANYPLVWLREMGRVHSASVQGGLLNLMTKSDIVLPDGGHIKGEGIAWVADSNYQAESDSTHTLVTFDDALRRRFSVNITMDYLSAGQEVQVLEHLQGARQTEHSDESLIVKVVNLGHLIRRQRLEGNLQSLAPPTIYGYLALLRMARSLPHLTVQQVAMATLLGNSNIEDRKHVSGVLNEVFGLQSEPDDQTAIVGNLF